MITNAIITAYCACSLCCGKANQLTASGTRPTSGRTIAAPRGVPFGSRVEVAGITFVVEDRTAKRFDGRYDIFMRSHRDALAFGRQTLPVRVVAPNGIVNPPIKKFDSHSVNGK